MTPDRAGAAPGCRADRADLADLTPDLDVDLSPEAGLDPDGEAAARGRHPSTHPWRTDHDGLAVRLAAHLEAAGWAPTAARAEAAAARETVRHP